MDRPSKAETEPQKAPAAAFGILKRRRAELSPQDVAAEHTRAASEQQDIHRSAPAAASQDTADPSTKRPKPEPVVASLKPARKESDSKTPDMATASTVATPMERDPEESSPKVPVSHVQPSSSSQSVSSDLSMASHHKHERRSPPTFAAEVPPAPPSTPASLHGTLSFDTATSPLPLIPSIRNAALLEQQQLLSEGTATPAVTNRAQQPFAEGAATPAPTKPSEKTLLPEDFSDWAVGDRYEMIRILGRGSYGEVAQAIDKWAGRPDAFVAIKRIQSPFDQEVDAVRLYREIHILRRMRGHDCIIQLLDVVQPPTDDLDDFHDLYLVFEYVDTDLYKLIMSPQYLSTEHIKTFLYQMLTALKYIHSFSVIHRDLKPANILLNEDCSLKICDFGLARIVDTDTMSFTRRDEVEEGLKPPASFGSPPKLGLTRQLTKHVVTRWYRAPELILIQSYTSAVDIWSLGCILAELLSMQEGNVPGYQDRKPLFPGGTCYPLSGEGDSIKKDERLDQLSVIFGVIGTPPPEDISAAGKANEYIESLGKIEGKPLEKLYPAADPAALDLLREMLQFSPKRRCTAAEALEHEFLKGVRRKELEIEADGPLEGPDFLETETIDLKFLKQSVFEEVRWFRDKGASEKKRKADSPSES